MSKKLAAQKAEQGARNFAREQRKLFDSFDTGGLGSGLCPKTISNYLVPVTVVTPSLFPRLVALLNTMDDPDNFNPEISESIAPPLNKTILDDQLFLQRFSQIEAGLNVDNLPTWTDIRNHRFSLGFNCIPESPPNQARLSTIPVILFPTNGDQDTLKAANKNRQQVIESQRNTCSPPEDGSPSIMVYSPQSSLIQVNITETPVTKTDLEANLSTKDLIETLTKQRDPILPYEPDFHKLEVNINSRKDLHRLALIIIIKTIQKTRLARQFCESYNASFDCAGSDMMRPLAVENMFERSPWVSIREDGLSDALTEIKSTQEFKHAKKYDALKAIKKFALNPCDATFDSLKNNHAETLLNKDYSLFFHNLLLEAIKHVPRPPSITLFSPAVDKLRVWLNASDQTHSKTYSKIIKAVTSNKALKRYNILLTLLDYIERPSIEMFLTIQAHKADILNDVGYFWPILGKIAKADFHADRYGKIFKKPKDFLEHWLEDPQWREVFRSFHEAHASMRDFRSKYYIPFNPYRRKSEPEKPSPRAMKPRRRSSSLPDSLPDPDSMNTTLHSGSAPR